MPDINVNKLSEALNTKADIDLNNTGVFSTSSGGVNLTSSTPVNASGKEVTSADFIKSDIQSNLLNYTTNRILEIPQDIKLELNNGSLVRKAGSKFYIPNGFETDGITPKFDVIIIDSDISCPVSGQNYPHLVQFFNPQNIADFPRVDLIACFSGTTAPSGYTIMVWYDISNNIMKLTTNGGSTWYSGFSLPYAITTETASGGYISIDQVFNGFGYIGSTVFVLPGVKVQAPNGRNADRTCKSIVTTTTKVNTYTPTMGNVNDVGVWLRSDGTFTVSHLFYYDSDKNQIIYSPNNKAYTNVCIAKLNWFDGKVAYWLPFTVDSVVNSNASNFSQAGRSYLSGLSMPSNKYIDLTLGATGATYTAPANGWFTINKHSTAGKLVAFENASSGKVTWIAQISEETDCRVSCPARTGDIVKLWHTADGKLNFFRFIYADGDQ